MRRVSWRIPLRAGRSGLRTVAYAWAARPYFTAKQGVCGYREGCRRRVSRLRTHQPEKRTRLFPKLAACSMLQLASQCLNSIGNWQLAGAVTAVSENGKCGSQMEELAAFGAFSADGHSRGHFFGGSAAVPPAAIVLGADYNTGNHAIIAGCGAHCFWAALRRHAIRGAPGRNRSHVLWFECSSIWNLRVPPGLDLRLHTCRPGCISLQRYHRGTCAADSAGWHRHCVASCLSSFRGSFYRDCGRPHIRVGLAGDGATRQR